MAHPIQCLKSDSPLQNGARSSSPKRLKILHTTTRLVRGGGVEGNIAMSIRGLNHLFDFHLATGVDFQLNPVSDLKNVKIFICPYLVNVISPLRDLRAFWYFYKLIKQEKYDIVHTHETKASFITRLAAWAAGCPFIIYGLHGVTFNDPMNWFKRQFYILLERITVGCSDYIVSVSKDALDHYHSNNIGNKIPHFVVRSGIDFKAFSVNSTPSVEAKQHLRSTLGILPGELVICNIGRFSFSKAQRLTIESFARIKQQVPNVRLVLLGEGELMEDCKQQVLQLGLESSVIFTGYRSDVSEILSISDLFLFTSLREGLPRAVVEASLMRVPVVAFEVEGIREIIEDTVSGFIVRQYDIDALTTRAIELLRDETLRRQFTERVFQHVRQGWDGELMAEQLQSIYSMRLQSI